jgi:ribosomal protein S18 acetylase RimI-like enzyme
MIIFDMAAAGDWARIDALYGERGPERGHFLRGVAGAGAWMVARRHDAIVGAGEVRCDAGRWEIANLRVAPPARRQGIGAALLAALLDVASARGAVEVELLVDAQDPAAASLYRRAGFRPVAVRRLTGGDALLMRVQLR